MRQRSVALRRFLHCRLIVFIFWVASIELGIAATRPNVLLIVSDDQRLDTIGAFGNPLIATPNLDRLARAGTAFRRATCANPLCVPSRAELLSGLTSFHNGFFTNGGLRNDVVLWPQVMQRAGYRTCYVGKWHTRGRPSTCGYEEVDGLFAGGKPPVTPQRDHRGQTVTGYVGWQFQSDDGILQPEKGIGLTPGISSEFADAAIRLLKGDRDRPFFLHVNFTAPHDPLLIPPGFEQRYAAERMPLPANFAPQHPFDHGNLKGRDELLLPFPRRDADVRNELAVYYAIVSHLDQQVGRILAALDQMELAENTIVIFTSDHGLAIGSHGLRGKQNVYEHTINVPLIFRGPGIPSGSARKTQCYLRDLFPTVCELTGIECPAVDGRSFAGAIRDELDEIHPYVVGYFADSQRMIREGTWKLICYPKADREQLFDVEADPFEMHNLIDRPEHATRAKDLRTKLTTWLTGQGDNAL